MFYGAVIAAIAVARIHPLDLMNERRLSGEWPPIIGCYCPHSPVPFYYYYSAHKLILVPYRPVP